MTGVDVVEDPPPASEPAAPRTTVVPLALLWHEAAILLGNLSRTRFYVLAASESFPAPVFYCGKRRWLVAELERWMLLQRPVPLTPSERQTLARPAPPPRRSVRRRH